jgi:hypothetical protein
VGEYQTSKGHTVIILNRRSPSLRYLFGEAKQ